MARTFFAGWWRLIALDGKTVRGARRRPDATAPHLIAALDHDAGVVLGQVCVKERSNEIPAARELLAALDLDGAVLTMDAMHTRTYTRHPPHRGGWRLRVHPTKAGSGPSRLST